MRKLASIQRIKSLEPIEDAIAIEKATVLGWQLVVKKDEFKVGDLVVYCEIDSIMPEKPEFEFLRPRNMRIRTIRLRGQISQGICFPLSILPLGFDVKEDADCTEILQVKKYEPPIPACLSGTIKGTFPSFIPKTDETRVQVLQRLIDKYEGEKCYVTEKLDGSSATFYLNNDEFGVCSRNMELIETSENSFWKVAREMDLENKMRSLKSMNSWRYYFDNFALQGELIGEGIQSNKLKLKGQSVRFFNAFNIDKFEYLSFEEFKLLLEILDLPMVPVVDSNYILKNDINSIISKSVIKSAICNDVWAEGIVIRPYREKLDLLLSNERFNNGRLSFKAINPEFLLKYE